MKPWAVIPVKSFALAKSRLVHLSRARRAALARSMFEHVLGVLRASPEVAGIAVLTNGDDVEAAARAMDVEVIRDPIPADRDATPPALGHIVDAALARLAARGIGSALVLMSDLPALEPRSVAELTACMRAHQVVIAPDLREMGTNALGLTPPDCMATCFGHADSLRRHLAAARQHGVSRVVHRDRALGLDLDLPADMHLFDNRTNMM